LAKTLRSQLSYRSDDEIAWICLDFDLAVLDHIEWVENREKAQVKVEAEPNRSRKHYTYEPEFKTVEALLALDAIENDTDTPVWLGRSTLTPSEVKRMADEALKDPEARRRLYEGHE
jgi:hypothetical protein